MRLPAFLAYFLPVILCAQSWPKALLWTVIPPTARDTSYLYGTIHSTDDRAFGLQGQVQQVMIQCATVAGELDLEGQGNVALTLMGRMMLPAGTDLQDLYTKREWKRLQPALTDKLGPLAVMMGRMKPFFILATLMDGDMASDRDRMLDDALMEHGRGSGKRVIGLETVAEQMNALDAIPLNEQAGSLYSHLLEPSEGEDMATLHDAYAEQDLERLWTLTNSASTGSFAFKKALLTDRNQVMVQRMDSVIMADTTALFLIGAAHLPGPDGLIMGLRALGYRVEPARIRERASPADGPRRAPHLE
ncbi:MAG: TraB/GumN family protein [Flavobacteriales bacterium]|nr:TraB/GumN family protein [Flavobacteriales bacterium]